MFSELVISECLPIDQAVEIATGQRPHIQTIRRWARRGISGVKLPTLLLNGRYTTSPKVVEEFIREASRAKADESRQAPRVPVKKPVLPSRVAKAVDEFERMTKAKAKPTKAKAIKAKASTKR